jgi:hypothetical protein
MNIQMTMRLASLGMLAAAVTSCSNSYYNTRDEVLGYVRGIACGASEEHGVVLYRFERSTEYTTGNDNGIFDGWVPNTVCRYITSRTSPKVTEKSNQVKALKPADCSIMDAKESYEFEYLEASSSVIFVAKKDGLEFARKTYKCESFTEEKRKEF